MLQCSYQGPSVGRSTPSTSHLLLRHTTLHLLPRTCWRDTVWKGTSVAVYLLHRCAKLHLLLFIWCTDAQSDVCCHLSVEHIGEVPPVIQICNADSVVINLVHRFAKLHLSPFICCKNMQIYTGCSSLVAEICEVMPVTMHMLPGLARLHLLLFICSKMCKLHLLQFTCYQELLVYTSCNSLK
jgi:hypothetical protein